jgi:hypothetical protein
MSFLSLTTEYSHYFGAVMPHFKQIFQHLPGGFENKVFYIPHIRLFHDGVSVAKVIIASNDIRR